MRSDDLYGPTLRDRAERFLDQKPEAVKQQPPGDVQNLIHELRIHQAELEFQNEDLKSAHQELWKEKERYKDLFEFVPVGYVVIDENRRIREVNRTACRMFGLDRGELEDTWFARRVHPDSEADFSRLHRKSMASGLKQQAELWLLNRDGGVFPAQLECSGSVGKHSDEPVMRVAIIDISDRKKTEALSVSLREKETLLKEIHHRVKNNLTVIDGLLDLHAGQTDHPEFYSVLEDCQNRIKAMAAVHEMMYQSEDQSRISLLDYFRKVGDALLNADSNRDTQIKFEVGGDDVQLSIDQTSPLGLAVTELITNSLKHAFMDRPAGRIRIDVRLENEREVWVRIADDGIGMPGGWDWRISESLGLQLVVGLVEHQLNGTFELLPEAGTVFQIRFINFI